MADRRLFKMGFSLLQVVGLNPLRSTGFGKIFLCIGGALLLLHFVSLIMESVLKPNKLLAFQINGVHIITIYQIIAKMIVSIIKRKNLKQLVLKVYQFKNMDGLDESLQSELSKTYKRLEMVLKVYIYNCMLCAILIVLRPVLMNLRIFPAPLYDYSNFKESPLYEVLYFFEVLEYVHIIFLAMGFDVLFFSFCIYIYGELKIIRFQFASARCVSTFQNLSACMRHHNFVLYCINDLNSVYSIYLLNHFLVSFFGTCVLALALISERTFSAVFVVHFLYLLGTQLQLFFYCFAGTQITEQTEEIANAIFYNVHWMNASTCVKRHVIAIIQRSQKNDCLSIGGMFDLNLIFCTQVLKASLSLTNAVLALKNSNT